MFTEKKNICLFEFAFDLASTINDSLNSKEQKSTNRTAFPLNRKKEKILFDYLM